MAIKYHTVILVPHARARLRKWRISNLQIFTCLSAFLLVLAASLFVLISHFAGSGVDAAQVQRLRSANQELREANRSFEQSLGDLQNKLADYETRTRKLAIVAGLDNLDGSEAGIGGEGTDGSDVDFLTYRANRLSGKLDRVAKKLEERSRWISSVPSVAPVKGILTSGFGVRKDPITGRRSFHPAIDIAAPPGRPVHAPADGIVTRAGRIGGLGNAVFISHGFGITTRFGHMSRLAVEPGQKVKQGDVIGYVGETGRATGYHLHYEVRVDGQPINPLGYILDGTPARG